MPSLCTSLIRTSWGMACAHALLFPRGNLNAPLPAGQQLIVEPDRRLQAGVSKLELEVFLVRQLSTHLYDGKRASCFLTSFASL